MSRTMVNRIRWSLAFIALGSLIAIMAWALPMVTIDYGKSTRSFRVCLLLLESQTKTIGPTTAHYWNPDPWILPVLNHSPFRPGGWTIYNPLAPGILPNDPDLIISGQIYSQDPKGNSHNWFTNDTKTPGTSALTKDDPAYWVVKLDDKSLDALAEFDLLIVNGHNEATLSNADRNRLRYLVERGATIWLNNSQRDGNQVNNFFLDPAIRFQKGPYPDTAGTKLVKIIPDHWLLTAYYQISDQEVDFLRDNTSSKSYILNGVAGYAGNDNSQVYEVVRLRPTDKGPEGKPALACGRVGNGLVVVSGTDVIGAVADWWEYKHNRDGLNDLNVWPYNESMHQSGKPNDHYIYEAACKLIYNMLARPATWSMVSGNSIASRTYDKSFAASLSRSWTASFTALTDPVSYGNYVAVVGNSDGSAVPSELRVYRTRRMTDDDGTVLDYPYGIYRDDGKFLTPSLDPLAHGAFFPWDATSDSEMDLCFTATAPAGVQWIGSPVFGQISHAGITRTVLYGLKCNVGAGTPWQFWPECYALDPYIFDPIASGRPQIGLLWTRMALPFIGGIPRASMTASNGRLIITTFGKTMDADPWRLFLVEGRTGALRARVGGSPEWKYHFRASSPASLVAAQMDFEASDLEAGARSDSTTSPSSNPMLQDLRRELVELMVVAGEYYPPTAEPTAGNGHPAMFLIPPTLTIKLATSRASLARIPPDLRLIENDPTGTLTPQEVDESTDPNVRALIHMVGDPSSTFRQKYILSVKAGGNVVKITFRNWDVFFPQGMASSPALTLPVTVAFTPDTVTATPTQPGNPSTSRVTYLPNVELSMGYPINLHSHQHYPYNLANRFTLRTADGDTTSTFGYQVDAPPVVRGDQLIIGTHTTAGRTFPTVNNSVDPTTAREMRRSGVTASIRLRHNGLSNSGFPASIAGGGEVVWQFFGDTHGPTRESMKQNYYWRSDFSLPAAHDTNTVYTVGVYRGYGDYYGYNWADATPADGGTLYALDPAPNGYLRQVVTAGRILKPLAAETDQRRLRISERSIPLIAGHLRVGARALLKIRYVQPGGGQDIPTVSWDMGTILRIDDTGDGTYWLTFNRDRLPNADLSGANVEALDLLVTTDVPHVSHVRAWDKISGSEPVRSYTQNGTTLVRAGEGISGTPPTAPATPVDASANPDARVGPQEVMIAIDDYARGIADLGYVCHEPDQLTGNRRLHLSDTPLATGHFLPTDWAARQHMYIPRTPTQGTTNVVTGIPDLNYTVDYRSGRIQLVSNVAGEFADRFVVVHYFTEDVNPATGVTSKTRHAEVMYVPTQVKWQYQFPSDVVVDSGPVVVNEFIYVTANRYTTDNKWQPVVYAFSTVPTNAVNVEPRYVQAIGPAIADGRRPYHIITTPTPTPNGVLVGTALPTAGPANELSLLSDRGLLIADGHRIVRVNNDGQVTWQASATVSDDPTAMSAGPAARDTALSQQGFTLVTRMQNLPNGNVLVCDTGANRVVEFNRAGHVIWQYPDSDLTFRDPDWQTEGVGLRVNPAAFRLPTQGNLRINGPRDARRYYKEIPGVPVRTPGVPVPVAATIRWETTLLADAGNNRILEVYRPLVRFDDVETINETYGLMLAKGFQYRPDVYYHDGVSNKLLMQYATVLVDDDTTKYPGMPYLLQYYDPASTITAYGKPLSFTQVMRYAGPDNRLTSTQGVAQDPDVVMSGVRTRELLAVVGNPATDPYRTQDFLRTVRISLPRLTYSPTLRNYATLRLDAAAGTQDLSVDYAPEFAVNDDVYLTEFRREADGSFTVLKKEEGKVQSVDMVGHVLRLVAPTANSYGAETATVFTRITRKRANALLIRAGSPYDYARVWQLDIVTVKMPLPATGSEVHALVVDQAGVREIPLDTRWTGGATWGGQPIFEMTASTYSDALSDGYWAPLVANDPRFTTLTAAEKAILQLKLDAWRADDYFAPVAVLRQSPNSTETTADALKVRYLISQMNPVSSSKPNTLLNGKAERRIHLFEAKWVYQTALASWKPSMIDGALNYYVFPDPLSADFPNLPGWTYGLTQPLCLGRD